ncbi:signal peptidase I [Arthrobacter crystallopoietes]|nr:signal peptidase I [Arthrobacter crystallopoietes]
MLGVAGLLAIRIWVVEPAVVDSDSMEPTLNPGSLVFVFKAAPQLSGIHPGDVVVFQSPEDNSTVIKRVVAMGNQTVEVRDAVLFVDGVAPDEPFVDYKSIDGTHFSLRHVPPGEVFVMGDNRERSIDSRDFGTLPLSSLQGLVLGAGR